MTKIFLVRHGESVLNKQGIISGHANPALTKKGKDQAMATKRELSHIEFDDVYSSDLIRAAKTAEIIYGRPVPKGHQVFALRERNFGSIDGKDNYHLSEEHEARKTLSHEENWTYRHVPDMESNQELVTRFINGLSKIAENNQNKTILVVAHGGAIRSVIMKLKGLGYLDVPNGSFQNAGYVELVYNQGSFNIVSMPGLKL